MRTTGITKSFTCLLIAITIPVLSGCTSRKFTRELSESLTTNIDTLNAESHALKGEQILNPDIITLLYEKGGELLSAKWNSRDKIAQMITAIHNASLDGLNPDDYHHT